MAGAVKEREIELQESRVTHAVEVAVHGALRVLGGMVQLAAGITKLVAVAAWKAAATAEEAVEASAAEATAAEAPEERHEALNDPWRPELRNIR